MKFWSSVLLRTALIVAVLYAPQPAEAAYNFYYKLSSLGQDVDYLQSALPEILSPAGYRLIPETVNVSDVIGSLGTAQTSASGAISYPQLGKNVQNDEYALRAVRFSALKSGRLFSGWVYLVIARTDPSGTPKVLLSSQARRSYTKTWSRDLWHSLAFDEKPLSFALEVRAGDLRLVEGIETGSEIDLPIWAVPRPHFPKATSAQIIEFARRRISGLLSPMGYVLDFESVDMSEHVVIGTGPGFPPSLRIVESEHLTLRSLQFRTHAPNQQVSTGGITLVIYENGYQRFNPNQSLERLTDRQGNPLVNLMLSADVDFNSFPLDVRFETLRLTPVFTGIH